MAAPAPLGHDGVEAGAIEGAQLGHLKMRERTLATTVPLVAVFSLAAEGVASACRCAPDLVTLEQAIAGAPIVVAGRVSSIGSFRSPDRGGTDPRVIELDVVRVVKGALEAKRVEVWNERAGTSCGGALARLEVGSHAVLALRYARAAAVAPDAVLRRAGIADPGQRVLTLASSACWSSGMNGMWRPTSTRARDTSNSVFPRALEGSRR